MPRLLKFFIILPVLVFLWGFLNSTGATRMISDATGLPNIATWTIPGIDKVVDVRNRVGTEQAKVEEKARRAALRALRKEVRARYGPEAAKLVPEDIPADRLRKVKPKDLRSIETLARALDLPDLAKIKPTPGSAPEPAQAGATITNGGPKLFNRARTALAEIPVKGRAPKTGYDRSKFGSEWSDTAGDFKWTRNGCDTRNDVLRRDLVKVTFKKDGKSCAVATGVLPYEPYTGAKNVKFVAGGDYANQFDIEHLVALGNAWQTGAQQWTATKRAAFANDPANLFAADPSSNRQKGDADAATWLPKNKAFRCAYVSRQTLVKADYGLWMTKAEKAAIQKILDGCAR